MVAKRHNDYTAFMKKVQRFIVTVLQEEKEESQKAHRIGKAVLGYDPKKWKKADANIRDAREEHGSYEKLMFPTPVMGHHKFSYCGRLYGDVHRFLAAREWRPIEHESNTSGVTWRELFILFDTTNARSEQGKHIKDRAAKKRADARI